MLHTHSTPVRSILSRTTDYPKVVNSLAFVLYAILVQSICDLIMHCQKGTLDAAFSLASALGSDALRENGERAYSLDSGIGFTRYG